MNLKMRAAKAVDNGDVRQVLEKEFALVVADVLMDWLLVGMNADANAPRIPRGKAQWPGGK